MKRINSGIIASILGTTSLIANDKLSCPEIRLQ